MADKFKGPFIAHSMGGKATAANLTPKQRKLRAQKSARARWAKAKRAA